jgi:IS5 family transposase
MVMMFKILVLQRSYNMSDDQTEYQLNDRITFMRFVGLGLGDRIPDAKGNADLIGDFAGASIPSVV